MLDTEFFYKGMIIENYVACQLAAIGIPLYYWESANTAEVDFLIDTRDGIIPLEVKAGKNKVSASMEVYRKKFAPAYILKARSGNFGFVNGIRNIPLYAVFCLDLHAYGVVT
jgi:predicted AAA+ superfamily ATPase